MKHFLIVFSVTILLLSCNNSENIIEGKWRIVDIIQTDTEPDTLTDLTILLLVYSLKNDDYDYIEFTNDKKYNLINKKKEIIETKTYFIKDSLLIMEDKNRVDTLTMYKKSNDLINVKSKNNFILSLKRLK